MHTVSSKSLMGNVRNKVQDISMAAMIILASVGAAISPLFLYQIVDAAPMNTVYVDNTKTCNDAGPGTKQLPFCTVQRGVDAVPNTGGTVNVAKGTYTEHVTITGKNNLTISGNGNNTIIQEPNTLNSGGAIVDVTNSQHLDLNQLTVSGPFVVDSCATEEYGIRLNDKVSANIEHVNVLDIRPASDDYFGCQQGVGIVIGRQSASAIATATLRDVTVKNYAKDGILVDNAGSDASIKQSTVTGRGPTTLTALNGIQVSRGATATIKQTTVTGNVYSPQTQGYTASGILIFQAGKVDISQTSSNKNDVGFDIDAATQNSSFTQNTANNNTTNGFYVEATAANNTFRQNTARNNTGSTYYTPYDVEDDSKDGKTLGTANTWHQTDCKTSQPDGICKL
jgi:parallel beta-helix repeat protein